jgi:hypothetical protein
MMERLWRSTSIPRVHSKAPSRRASTIAALARIISERKVGKGLRATLLTQARRLKRLAAKRLDEFEGTPDDGDEDIESKD